MLITCYKLLQNQNLNLRERISDREEREISENYFLLIYNDIFHKELRAIYSNQYGYYL